MLKKLPFIVTIFGMSLGVFIAILFGINEEIFKGKIQVGLEKNIKIQSIEDVAKRETTLKTEASQNWRYYQRFHFHSTGIGAMAMGTLLLLAFVVAPASLVTLASYLTAIGGFLYPFVWLFAGLYGPEMGRTEAKEAFAVFGYMGGVFLIGLLLSIYLVARYPLTFLNKRA